MLTQTVRPSTRSLIKQEFLASIQLTMPLAASQLAQAATGFVDTVIMGWLGSQTLAAGGLGAAIFMTVYVGGLGVINGVTPLVAQAHGAQNRRRIRQLTAQGLWLSLLVALPVMLLLSQAGRLMRWIGQAETVIQPAQTYLNILTWAYFPAIAFIMLRGIVSSIGAPRMPMLIALVGLGFNLVANYVLAFGKFGFPAMGLIGVAIASLINYWSIFLALLLFIFWDRQIQQYHLFAKLWEINLGLLGELIRLGVPIGVSFTTEVGLFSVTTFLMGLLGTQVLAAHQIVFQTTAISLWCRWACPTPVRFGWGIGWGRKVRREFSDRPMFVCSWAVVLCCCWRSGFCCCRSLWWGCI